MAGTIERPRTELSVRFEDVHAQLGAEQVLGGVSFDVRPGEFVCLVGPSGCGKSTALRMMGGLLPFDSGTVTVEGGSPDDTWGRIAYVFQSPRTVAWRSALGNVLLGMELRSCGGSKAERRKTAMHYLEMVGLTRDVEKPVSALSGGERQRVAIARALAVDPDIVLMDEPLSALDVATKARLRDEIIELWQATQKTIVFVTHDLDEALYMADRVVVFSTKPTTVMRSYELDQPRPRSIKDDARLSAIRDEVHTLFVNRPLADAPPDVL